MTSSMRRLGAATAIIAFLLLTRLPVGADEIKVMTSGAFTGAYLELAREFERSTGHHIVTEATAMGTGSTSIPDRLERGEAIEVVIVADGDLEGLIKAGRIRPGTRVDLARSAIGNGGSTWRAETRHQLGRCAAANAFRGQVDRVLGERQRNVFVDGTVSATGDRR